MSTGSDNFAAAPNLTIGGSNTANSTGLTNEVDEPFADNIKRTAWWKFTATADGRLDLDMSATVDLGGGTYYADPVLDVFTGTSLTDLTLYDWDDDSGAGYMPKLSIPVTAGTTYYIQAGVYDWSNDAVYDIAATAYSNVSLTIPFGALMPEGWTHTSFGTYFRRFLAVNGPTKTAPGWEGVVDTYTDNPAGALDVESTDLFLSVDNPGYDAYARAAFSEPDPPDPFHIQVYGQQTGPFTVPDFADVANQYGEAWVYPVAIVRRRGMDTFISGEQPDFGGALFSSSMETVTDLGGGWERRRGTWTADEAGWDSFAALIAAGEMSLNFTWAPALDVLDLAWLAIEFTYREPYREEAAGGFVARRRRGGMRQRQRGDGINMSTVSRAIQHNSVQGSLRNIGFY